MGRTTLLAMNRRRFLGSLGAGALALPLGRLLFRERRAWAAKGRARRVIFFYFPDGVAGASADGQPSEWHATGTEHKFQLGAQLEPLAHLKDECVFLNGVGMGSVNVVSHGAGARKLLTAVENGNGESIDRFLARTFGAPPHRMIYLGVMSNFNAASADKHISYPTPGLSTPPTDDPRQAFRSLFGGNAELAARRKSVIDLARADLLALKSLLGTSERRKLDLHLEALREVEERVTALPPAEPPAGAAACTRPSPPATPTDPAALYDPAAFPELARTQMDLLVAAMACGLTRVATLQLSQHTSELIMSRFQGSEMYDPDLDMRSHQASHYGPSHDDTHVEYRHYVLQRRWFVSQFAYLLERLRAIPEAGGTMLDHSLLLLCTEICDGNSHLHDNMPFVLAGKAGGAIRTGRLLQYSGERHANLLVAIARAAGQDIQRFGEASTGPLPGLLA